MPKKQYTPLEPSAMFSENTPDFIPDAATAPEVFISLPEVGDAELTAACRARVCPSCPEKKEAGDARLRDLADVDNIRKRLAREKEEYARYASESVLADVLPSLDTLDLALSHAPREEGSKNFVIGVDMTRKMLLEALARHGLAEVGALGEPFDPAMHEAISHEEHPDYPPDTVCGLMSKGYRLKDRLLRPAKVAVCKGK